MKTDSTRKRRATPRRRIPFRKHFTTDELDRVITAFSGADSDSSSEPDEVDLSADIDAIGIDAVTEATYVLLDRIIARISVQGDDDDQDSVRVQESFLKLVRAHNETTGRVTQLVRARQLIRGGAGEALTKNVAEALDSLSEHFNETL